jgi:beta-phosphoglucomutase family hydrolase
MTLPPHIRGLVFDLDGTLADTMPSHFKAWNECLATYGHQFEEALFYEFAGIPTLKIFQLLNERHGWNVPPEEATVLKEQLFERYIPDVLPIEPVVKYIHEFKGTLPMAIATGGQRHIATKTLSALGLTPHFQAIVTADDVLHGKPAPDIFLEAARRIGVPPTDCVAFEDADLGVQAARAAGMAVIDVRRWPAP